VDTNARVRWGILGTAGIAEGAFLPALAEVGGGAAGGLAGRAVGLLDPRDGVAVLEDERLVRRRRDADLGARAAGDGLVEPDLLHEGRVLDQPEQGGPGGHQRPPCLLLGQPVETGVQGGTVLVEEAFELDPERLVDDVLGERPGKR